MDASGERRSFVRNVCVKSGRSGNRDAFSSPEERASEGVPDCSRIQLRRAIVGPLAFHRVEKMYIETIFSRRLDRKT